MNSVTVVARRRDGEWRGAISIDNDFQDTVTAQYLDEVFSQSLDPVLDAQMWNEGDRIQITATIVRAPK